MELKSEVIQITERQTMYVLTPKWILDKKLRITSQQSTNSKKKGNKDNPERPIWICQGREK